VELLLLLLLVFLQGLTAVLVPRFAGFRSFSVAAASVATPLLLLLLRAPQLEVRKRDPVLLLLSVLQQSPATESAA
jgi:hypothetical protein